MSTWYKVTHYGHKIEEVEVVKHTEKCIWIKSEWFGKEKVCRAAKVSQYEHSFASWKEAHSYLLERCETSVKSLKQRTSEANSILGQVRKMKEPSHE